MSQIQTNSETYIGDGVRASCDGYQIWLRTDRGFETHEIALEPEVFKALIHFVFGLGRDASKVFGLEWPS